MNGVVNLPESSCDGDSLGDTPPGTVVWVGPTDHPEFRDAFHALQAASPQLAVRSDQAQFLARPATDVQRIIFARVRRTSLLPAVAPELKTRYPNASVLLLNGSLCDGERRSGQPWKSFTSVRFDRWHECMNGMEHTNVQRVSSSASQSMTLFLFDRYVDAEPWLAVARSQPFPAIWARRYSPLTMSNVQRIVWDETVAPKSPRWDWPQAIASCNASADCEHHWLVTQPQADDISYAMQAGVCAVHSKPLCDTSFLVAAHRSDSERD